MTLAPIAEQEEKFAPAQTFGSRFAIRFVDWGLVKWLSDVGFSPLRRSVPSYRDRRGDRIIARPHVLAVVIWICGVSMATTVALPAVRSGYLGENRLQAFQAIEHRFVWQARTAISVVGLTGFYMTWRLDLWDRFDSVAFWWMFAMVCLWLLFGFVLFIAEPFILHRHFRWWAAAQPQAAFAWLHWAHWVLLVLRSSRSSALSRAAREGRFSEPRGWPC
jgi:hypothetical protein